MHGRTLFVAINLRTLFAIGLFGTLLFAALVLRNPSSLVTAPATEYVAGKRVVIDAGHGGIDPGAVGPGGLVEKDVTLGVALALERLLNRIAVHSVMVRNDDRDLADPGARSRKAQDLERRVELGRTSGADIYISLHANSFPGRSLSGAQTFYQHDDQDGRTLAVAIQSRLVSELGPNRRQAQAADYYVLRKSDIPAVVIELGFLSNPREEVLLASPAYQIRLAEAIALGIIDYFTSSGGPVQPTAASAPVTPELKDDEFLLYFASPYALDVGPTSTVRLWPEQPPTDLAARAEAVLTALVRGPLPSEDLVTVMPEGVVLRSVDFNDDTLRVDFSAALRDNFRGGAREERLLTESIVLTLAQFDEVAKVQLTIEGRPATSIGGHMHLGEPFTVERKGRP